MNGVAHTPQPPALRTDEVQQGTRFIVFDSRIPLDLSVLRFSGKPFFHRDQLVAGYSFVDHKAEYDFGIDLEYFQYPGDITSGATRFLVQVISPRIAAFHAWLVSVQLHDEALAVQREWGSWVRQPTNPALSHFATVEDVEPGARLLTLSFGNSAAELRGIRLMSRPFQADGTFARGVLSAQAGIYTTVSLVDLGIVQLNEGGWSENITVSDTPEARQALMDWMIDNVDYQSRSGYVKNLSWPIYDLSQMFPSQFPPPEHATDGADTVDPYESWHSRSRVVV